MICTSTPVLRPLPAHSPHLRTKLCSVRGSPACLCVCVYGLSMWTCKKFLVFKGCSKGEGWLLLSFSRLCVCACNRTGIPTGGQTTVTKNTPPPHHTGQFLHGIRRPAKSATGTGKKNFNCRTQTSRLQNSKS